MKLIQSNIYLYFLLIILALSGFVFSVIWPNALGFYAFIAVMATGGLGVTFYIYETKSNNRVLVCPTGSNCNAVINSPYSKFLGVSLEYWGMIYYGLILISYLGFIFTPNLLSNFMRLGLSLMTTGAFLFSLYLLFIQAFILRQWCIWCILSASLSITIFIISLVSTSFAIYFLSNMVAVLDFVNTLGFGLGIGGVSVALFLFSKFLKDSNINNTELQTLKEISEMIWLGLVLVLVSHFALYVINPSVLSKSASFLIQTISLFVAGISGAVLMIIFAPFLTMIPFGQTDEENKENNTALSSIGALEKPFFATSAISLSSWYFAFVVNYLTSFDLFTLFISYLIVLFIAVVLSLVWEKRIERLRP